ncbi:hypothetical protein I6N96_07975 [Enterococcus sp. BWM-S5]|uniref:DUF1310 family protein n=1 Tax=Enterococcus larvae TaxID=2794352 RepID=A0ABS4CIC6_9ENTE|nr:hypothetical protein [Enterococcus larvae]MBP1046219.1 hypothetical protein [Enterococcus larvae]
MKKKVIITLIIVLLLIIGVGGGFYMFKQKEKEAQVIEWEKVAAKQIKNTFADIEEIRFSDKYRDNWLAGIVAVTVELKTSENVAKLTIDLPLNEDDEKISSYGSGYGGIFADKGITENDVKVIYSNGQEETL